jgi:hypothetical protein
MVTDSHQNLNSHDDQTPETPDDWTVTGPDRDRTPAGRTTGLLIELAPLVIAVIELAIVIIGAVSH